MTDSAPKQYPRRTRKSNPNGDGRSKPVSEWSPERKASLQRFIETCAGKGRTARHTDKEIAKALLDNGGCMAQAAASLGYSVPGIYSRIRNSEELKHVLAESRAETVYKVTDGLIAGALKFKDDPRYFAACKLVLELFGKPHGIYVDDKVQIEHTGTVTQQIDEAQVESFKAALERAVKAQVEAQAEREDDGIIEVE